jgi:DNA invertase Pin-like site-specific DNA recombinase
MIFGYARVSSEGQALAGQEAALAQAGAAKVYREKVSGAVTNRPQLDRLLRELQPDDVLIVCKIDRLARSTRDLLNVLHLVATKGAGFRSLGDPWCDTTTPHGKLLTTVLAGFAEFERSLIVSRTSEGRARAKAAGRPMGRRHKLDFHQRREALARREAGETVAAIARTFGVSHTTICRLPASRPAGD